MSRIEDIQARLDAATPGPWKLASADSGPHDFVVHAADKDWTDIAWSSSRRGRDADLIAHAPADLRDLLAVADAARDVPVQHEARCSAWNGWNRKCDCRVADLNAALARLVAVTGGETS